ncbi:hypothetical protein [Streptomyces sp. HPF1205]|uniref:hypothetical protein n=1 Tax=Streptomyces sp. HPF1205 TaxID=2873262 RepID=UPI001CEDD301|nr:hypothetical protein [Streptomyces sp. HPF1205]
MSVIVVELITPDGIVSDPDGSHGTPPGGWMFRYGGKAVGTQDGLRLGPALEEGVLPLGRVTRPLFARTRPGRRDARAARMNAAAKPVASRTAAQADTSARAGSTVPDGDLVGAGVRPADLELLHAAHVGPAVLTRYRGAAR